MVRRTLNWGAMQDLFAWQGGKLTRQEVDMVKPRTSPDDPKQNLLNSDSRQSALIRG